MEILPTTRDFIFPIVVTAIGGVGLGFIYVIENANDCNISKISEVANATMPCVLQIFGKTLEGLAIGVVGGAVLSGTCYLCFIGNIASKVFSF